MVNRISDFPDDKTPRKLRPLRDIAAEQAVMAHLVRSGSFEGIGELLEPDDFVSEETSRFFVFLKMLPHPCTVDRVRGYWRRDPAELDELLAVTEPAMQQAAEAVIDCAAVRAASQAAGMIASHLNHSDVGIDDARSLVTDFDAVLAESIAKWNRRRAAIAELSKGGGT